jgi:hypothetical protein
MADIAPVIGIQKREVIRMRRTRGITAPDRFVVGTANRTGNRERGFSLTHIPARSAWSVRRDRDHRSISSIRIMRMNPPFWMQRGTNAQRLPERKAPTAARPKPARGVTPGTGNPI